MILSTEATVKYLLESVEIMCDLEPYDAYYYLVGLWGEINVSPILVEQLEAITAQGGDQIQAKFNHLFNDTASQRAQWESTSLLERQAFSLLVVKKLATLSSDGVEINNFFSESMTKGIYHHNDMDKLKEGKNRFIQYYFKPFIMACINGIEKQGAINTVLAKYKQFSEWFDNQKLLADFKKLAGKQKKIEEKVLQPSLYAFMYKEGVDFVLTPSLGADPKGMPDFVAAIDKDKGIPFIGEVKYIKSNATPRAIKAIVKSGIHQLCKYLDLKLLKNGYLVIFNCSKSYIALTDQEETVNECIHKYSLTNGKICRVIIVDLIPVSPSKIASCRKGGIINIDAHKLL